MQAAWDLAETHRLIEHPAVRLLRSPNCALADAINKKAGEFYTPRSVVRLMVDILSPKRA